MDGGEASTRGRLWLRFCAGMIYLAFVAAAFSAWTQLDFLTLFAAVVCGALFTSGLCLVWLARAAADERSRLGQFSIGSLAVLVVLASLYFAVVRWLVTHLEPTPLDGTTDVWIFLLIATICLFLAILSIPFVLGMLESLVWLSVWLVRRRLVQQWLRRRRV